MKRFQAWFQQHQTKLWLLTIAAAAILIFNAAAVVDARPGQFQPGQWEYKTIWFRANAGDDTNELQQRFTDALNREAINGWEFVGRCGHTNGKFWWTDYVVFKRPRW